MDKKTTFAVLLLALAIYSVILITATAFIKENLILALVSFTVAYASLISVFILNINPLSRIKDFSALILSLLAFDIISPPLLVSFNASSQASLSTNPLALFSTDLGLYTALPSSLPQELRFAIVYLVVPALLIVSAMLLTKNKKVIEAGA